MIKKVIDFDRLHKQEYLKPAMEVVEIGVHAHILAGSVASVITTGLDIDDELILPGSGLPTTGSITSDAW